MDWTAFQKSLETLLLKSPIEIIKHVEEVANILVNKIGQSEQRKPNELPRLHNQSRHHAAEICRLTSAQNRRLTKTTTRICPITNRVGARCYDAPARVKAIAEYLEGQFSPNPPAPIHNDARTLCKYERGGKVPRNPCNIHPSILLSHVAKTFERALLRKLSLFVSSRTEQIGFHTGHSTTLQFIQVLHHLASEMNCGRYTMAVFLGMKKVFDRVWHDGLLHKLLKIRLPSALTKIITNFLCDRSFCVAVEYALSASRSIRAGVLQGNCLSPSLFAAFTNDIPTLQGQLKEWEYDVMLGTLCGRRCLLVSARRADLAAKKI
ncbi:Probable RNA-directed DNA polymerase from transposon BS [Eumeta japonica]|uniref:Probable RNA-directed DNA polymerase from transposon BS n=1 Tax=Eumeta variegata TaxID=151549 RepID=A0A4C1YP96_EUMVA|nr:Probable RNA-directed DNA polymerase from transposon BS [Eumeta japonica]